MWLKIVVRRGPFASVCARFFFRSLPNLFISEIFFESILELNFVSTRYFVLPRKMKLTIASTGDRLSQHSGEGDLV